MESVRFGFEAEFGVNAAQLQAALFGVGLSGDHILHDYHCDCEYCSFRGTYGPVWPLRGQNDSSCAGEIISQPLTLDGTYCDGHRNWTASEIINTLCEQAQQVDAEPDLNSGFHVHVNYTDIGGFNADLAFAAYVAWEPQIARLAGGRWANQREGVNESVRRGVRSWIVDHAIGDETTPSVIARLAEDNPDELHSLRMWHLNNDRHSNLNLGTRYNTWEFRLWNATRSAERMEFFVRMSLALMTPEVYTKLLTASVTVCSLEEFISALPTDLQPVALSMYDYAENTAPFVGPNLTQPLGGTIV